MFTVLIYISSDKSHCPVASEFLHNCIYLFDLTIKTKLPWQSSAGVNTWILKKRMKTVANKTCFAIEVPRKNELVHVVKTGFNRLYIMFFKLLHDTCWPRRVFGSLWTERKLLKIWVAIVQALELQEDIESCCAFFTPLFFR